MMLAALKRYLATFRGEPVPDVLAPVQPKVTPDPRHAAELEKRFSTLAHSPENGFHRDQRQERANVIPMRRRAR